MDFSISVTYIDPDKCKIKQVLIFIEYFLSFSCVLLTIYLVCLAVETDLQTGAQYKYEVVVASISYFHLYIIFLIFLFCMPFLSSF